MRENNTLKVDDGILKDDCKQLEQYTKRNNIRIGEYNRENIDKVIPSLMKN